MFFKKPHTVESLMKKCEKDYNTFIMHLGQAHYESYFEFKTMLKDDFQDMFDALALTTNEKTTLALLNHFHKQLQFIHKCPFSANKEEFENFIHNNYPYKEKLNQVVAESLNNSTKLKM